RRPRLPSSLHSIVSAGWACVTNPPVSLSSQVSPDLKQSSVFLPGSATGTGPAARGHPAGAAKVVRLSNGFPSPLRLSRQGAEEAYEHGRPLSEGSNGASSGGDSPGQRDSGAPGQAGRRSKPGLRPLQE